MLVHRFAVFLLVMSISMSADESAASRRTETDASMTTSLKPRIEKMSRAIARRTDAVERSNVDMRAWRVTVSMMLDILLVGLLPSQKIIVYYLAEPNKLVSKVKLIQQKSARAMNVRDKTSAAFLTLLQLGSDILLAVLAFWSRLSDDCKGSVYADLVGNLSSTGEASTTYCPIARRAKKQFDEGGVQTFNFGPLIVDKIVRYVDYWRNPLHGDFKPAGYQWRQHKLTNAAEYVAKAVMPLSMTGRFGKIEVEGPFRKNTLVGLVMKLGTGEARMHALHVIKQGYTRGSMYRVDKNSFNSALYGSVLYPAWYREKVVLEYLCEVCKLTEKDDPKSATETIAGYTIVLISGWFEFAKTELRDSGVLDGDVFDPMPSSAAIQRNRLLLANALPLLLKQTGQTASSNTTAADVRFESYEEQYRKLQGCGILKTDLGLIPRNDWPKYEAGIQSDIYAKPGLSDILTEIKTNDEENKCVANSTSNSWLGGLLGCFSP